MRKLIERARRALLSAADTVCLERARLVTEAWRRHEKEPAPVRRARAFEHVLRNMTLDLETNPVFAGNTSARPRAWMLVPEHGFGADAQVLIENDGLAGLLEGAIPSDLEDYWRERSFGGNAGIGHLAVDLDRVVHEGLESIIAEAEGYPDEADGDKRTCRRAMSIALRAVIEWAHRYADAAEAAARSARDPALREAHLRVAEACRRVPAEPARNLFEGLQAMVLVHLAVAIEGHGMSISIGLPDRVLAPFVGRDFDAESATDLVSAFILKIAANSFQGRGSKTQAITVGGLNHRGEDQSGALTLCFLDACDRVRVGDPHLFLRWHRDIDPEVKRRAVEMLSSGVSMPLLIHDEPTARGFVAAGVAEEDAWDYCVIGCNELGIPGRSAESATAVAGVIQYLELLNRTLFEYHDEYHGEYHGEHPDEHPDPEAIRDMGGLLSRLEATTTRRALEMREGGQKRRKRMAERVPTPFTSALMRGCIRRGRDMLVGMDYHLPGVYERGLTNAANGLAAIERVVFEERSFSMTELLDAMRSNFEDASVRERLLPKLNRAPKWGTDDDRADRWALELVAMRERALDAADARFGHRPHMSCHVVRSLHHLDGRRIAASPDGRLAWTPVADSIGAQTGTALAGPTAVLASVLKLDAARNYRGGYNLNLTLSKAAARPEILLALVEVFFRRGGQELQISCLDASILRAAQARPEEYGDLLVRIAGFNARFVDLSAEEQAELILRAEAAGNGD